MRAVTCQQGLSLVEMMVTVTLSLLLSAAVVSVYHSNKNVYRENDSLSRVQEAIRIAVEFLRNDAMNAGAYGCAAASLDAGRSYSCGDAVYQKGGLKNTLVNGTTDYRYNFATPIEGFETAIGASSWTPNLDSSLTTARDENNIPRVPLPGSDVLSLRGPDGSSVTVVDQASAASYGAANLKVITATELNAGDIVVAGNCEDSAVFQISDIAPSPDANSVERLLGHTIASGTPGNACPSLGREYRHGQVTKVSTKSYYVAIDPRGLPALYRLANGVATELVTGIENLQVQYGFDANDDGVVDDYRSADAIAGNDWIHVVSLRIDMVAVSQDVNVTLAQQSYTIAGSTLTPSDGRFRQVASMVAAVRNKLH